VDTDPDGLSGKVTNRRSLKFDGLSALRDLPDQLSSLEKTCGTIPVTWFVRADGQLESILGSVTYLLETYQDLWLKAQSSGHELGWHPHLYRQQRADDDATMITDPAEASDEIERLWSRLFPVLSATSFRNGEGWHSPQTYATVEHLGFLCDSTALPGRRGVDGHPMNWLNAPNQPYFPGPNDLCVAGPQRALVELPMNTWQLQGPHDATPRTRYMNPAVHPQLLADSLKGWADTFETLASDLCVWVLIFHPDEVFSTFAPDALYARSLDTLCANLASMSDSVRRLGHEFEWVTVSRAAQQWRDHHRQLIA
jgi:hypothetical protein